jgi:hypothetical protein
MNQANVGDYVLFKYNGTRMTGLIRDVIEDGDSKRYEIVPSAIGLDYFPIIESKNVKKISAKNKLTKTEEWQFE